MRKRFLTMLALFAMTTGAWADWDGGTYTATGVGGTAISGWYWSATDHVTETDASWTFESANWYWQWRNNTNNLRPVLGF